MRLWYWGVTLFLVIGLLIALLSMYKASVEGLMKKVGLVDSDFSVSVAEGKLDDLMLAVKGQVSCGLANRMRGSLSFMLAGDNEQGRLAFELGRDRIKCGAMMLGEGDVETGTYEMIKGIGYLNQGYGFVAERMGVDRRVCEGLPEAEVEMMVKSVLEATSGRVYQIIWNDWNDLQVIREPVEKGCLDQRIRSR